MYLLCMCHPVSRTRVAFLCAPHQFTLLRLNIVLLTVTSFHCVHHTYMYLTTLFYLVNIILL